jgi:hypothetical protein
MGDVMVIQGTKKLILDMKLLERLLADLEKEKLKDYLKKNNKTE